MKQSELKTVAYLVKPAKGLCIGFCIKQFDIPRSYTDNSNFSKTSKSKQRSSIKLYKDNQFSAF